MLAVDMGGVEEPTLLAYILCGSAHDIAEMYRCNEAEASDGAKRDVASLHSEVLGEYGGSPWNQRYCLYGYEMGCGLAGSWDRMAIGARRRVLVLRRCRKARGRTVRHMNKEVGVECDVVVGVVKIAPNRKFDR